MHRIVPLIAAVAVVATACGGSAGGPATPTPTTADGSVTTMIEGGNGDQTSIATTDSSVAPSTTPGTVPPVELPDSDYPDIVVTDLAGGSVNLRELALATQPTLVWFWAPH